MERERPEYLPPIERRRWEFPWLAILAVALLAVMGTGVHMLMETNAAWQGRFKAARPTTAAPVVAEPITDDAGRSAKLAEIRLKRAQAEAAAKLGESAKRAEQTDLKCINGVLFRRIPGGWENLPGEDC